MKEEVATVKSRLKTLQKDLAEERTELAELKKYDPQRLRKNLDGAKRKLADKTNAADKLQKSLSEARSEKAQLEQKVKDLEAQLEQKVKDLEAQLETATAQRDEQTEDSEQAAA
jgi:predicted  nucleic acid-binding Zn-ribbon protein